MLKRHDLTEEQFFKLRFRYTWTVAVAYIITVAVCIYVGWYMFFAHYGVLRTCYIAHFVTAGVVFAWVRNTLALPKTILTKGRKGVQFHPLWVSLCYERLPQRLKGIVNRECSKHPDMQPEEALLRIANKLNLISFIFFAAGLICVAIGAYRYHQNLLTIGLMRLYTEGFSAIVE